MSTTRSRPKIAPSRRRQARLQDGPVFLASTTSPTAGSASLALTRLAYLIVALGLICVLYSLLTASTFAARDVRVTGTRLLDPTTVVSASGAVGANLFRLNSRSIVQNVASVGVATRVDVEPALPGSVTIAIVEPAATYVWQIGTASYFVSDGGVVLGPASSSSLPRVVDAAARPVEVGKTVDLDVLPAADYVLKNLPLAAGFRVSSVKFSQDSGISVRSPEGRTIVIGDGTNLPDKLAAIAPLQHAASASPGSSVLDVSIPKHPYFR